MRRRVAGIILVTLVLGGCSSALPGPEARFCKRENRRIPDVELKARLLLSMRQQLKVASNGSRIRGGIPDYMESYLSTSLPANATDPQILQALQQIVIAKPLCCQFNTVDFSSDDEGNPYYWNAPDAVLGDGSKHPKDETYFANFYALGKNLIDISQTRWKEMPYTNYRLAAAYSCGYADVID